MLFAILAKRAPGFPVSAAVCLVVSLTAVVSPAPAMAAQAPCADVLVLGARGSGQPASGNAADGGTGAGREVFDVYQRISQVRSDRTVALQALHYPARGAELLLGDPTSYFAGLERGVRNAKRVLGAQAKRCPQQRFVLAGYSQGAMVMHRVLQDLTRGAHADTSLAGRIDGAVLLADGDRRAKDTVVSLGSARGGAGISYAAPSTARPRTWSLPARLAARVISVCEDADIVCDFRSPFQVSASGVDGTTVHADSYVGSPDALRAAELVAARIR